MYVPRNIVLLSRSPNSTGLGIGQLWRPDGARIGRGSSAGEHGSSAEDESSDGSRGLHDYRESYRKRKAKKMRKAWKAKSAWEVKKDCTPSFAGQPRCFILLRQLQGTLRWMLIRRPLSRPSGSRSCEAYCKMQQRNTGCSAMWF